MSMEVTVIGAGAGGNKAAITLIEKGVVDKSHVKMLNTSSKDVPEKYSTDKSIFIQFGTGLGGAGKEPARGRAAMIEAINSKQINFSDLINEDSKEVILVGSVEGGTGSGSIPVMAQYFDAMDIPVHVFAFIGFQDEARGMNNTLKFFKELPSSTILHTIMNKYFLDYTKNYSIAEQAANEEFAKEIEILIGTHLQSSKQVIDDTDLYKINTQPGYMTINHIPLTGIKNMEGFNDCIIQAFENSCYLDCDQSSKRIAVIINASKKIQKAVDNSFEVIKRYVGTPIETFQHIQPDDEYSDVDEDYIDVICCGMNYPEKALRDINAAYNKLKEKLNTSRKSFNDIFANIDTDDDDLSEFDADIKTKLDPGKLSGVDIFDQGIKSKTKQNIIIPEATPIPTSGGTFIEVKEEPKQQPRFINTEKVKHQDSMFHSSDYSKQPIQTATPNGQTEVVEMDVEMEDPNNPIDVF